MFDILLWSATVSFLSFYFGNYYGENIYRICRYIKLVIKRKWKYMGNYKKNAVLNA